MNDPRRADGGVDMVSKEAAEDRSVAKLRRPSPTTPPSAPSGRILMPPLERRALPARFLEGTAWDEV